ncbi:MAG: 1-acyl-sn-glycerol-3-phosphate acyltransferase [Oscillospiraceae bacterium]|nr:1-acyl-sn-glycerol-3-phosphate acyltransferase [Oscillospiraceae bacterium]
MIIGADRMAVIENIKLALSEGDFHRKTEIGDPDLTSAEQKYITDKYLNKRNSFLFKVKTFFMRIFVLIATELINSDTEIVGEIDREVLKNGAIITSNHFGPLENTAIRKAVKHFGGSRLFVVSQATNFAMKGFIGAIMNYADTIPLSTNAKYFAGAFTSLLKEKISKKQNVLIYPEQEMWFNFKKPRPFKRGAYHFAAKFSVPVVSCFVEMIDTNKKDTDEFYKVKYRVHVLGVLYPDSNKNTKEASEELCQRDYELKKGAYERIYKKKLNYSFEYSDIAGLVRNKNEG